MLATILIPVGALAAGTYLYLQQPKFGAPPEGARLEKIESSANYADGQFVNQVPTPQIVGDSGFISATWDYLVKEKDRPVPRGAVPAVKTNLRSLDQKQNVVVWLGHSSYFIQLRGKTFLIDPVLSDSAAPVPYVNQAFAGANPYTADDFPKIDYLLISHDHWDHLDYPSVAALKPNIGRVICGLGVGAYFERWGFAENQIQEADWNASIPLENGLTAHVLPARHYSGRMLVKNKTLWAGFALTSPELSIFYSGDSGYGPHFKEIGERFGGFDLAMLDNGQYDKSWPYIHMTPEEAAKAAGDLKAKALLPSHAGKFSIANHPWDEPFARASQASERQGYRLVTPIIGEPVDLENARQIFAPWWETIE